jgi:hypothetical protein
MKNKQEKLLLEITRLHELMYIGKNLLNEQLGEESVKFFKSIFHTSAVDKQFAKSFNDAFEHLKVNDAELIDNIKTKIGHKEGDFSLNDLLEVFSNSNIKSLKSETLVSVLEELEGKLIKYIFSQNTQEAIEVVDTIIETYLSRPGNEGKKVVYDYLVDLAQKGEKEELESAIKKYQPYFPADWFNHIRNNKYIKSSLDVAADAADELLDKSTEQIAKTGSGLINIGGKIIGLPKFLFNNVGKGVEWILDGIVRKKPNFSKTTFIRGYKGLVTNKEWEKLLAKADELNARYLNLISTGDQEGLQKLEKEIAEFLQTTNSWMLTDQIRILKYWKEQLFELSTNAASNAKKDGDKKLADQISRAVDEFFGVQTSSDGKIVKVDDAKRNFRYDKLQNEIDYALSIEGEQFRINKQKYTSALSGLGNLLKFGFGKNGEGFKKWGQRLLKFLAYGEPRLFSETAENIIKKQGIRGYWAQELKRRMLFAFVYWWSTYTLQDLVKAYIVGTDVVDKDGKHSLGYNTVMALGGPNTKWPENRKNDGKYQMFGRWLGMATINYWGVKSDWFANNFLGGDKEWAGLNVATPDEKKNNPALALEKESRRGNIFNKFFESPFISFYQQLGYINAQNAQTKLESLDRGYKDLQINSLKSDPNFKNQDSAYQKRILDSLEMALDQMKPVIKQAQEQAANDLKD